LSASAAPVAAPRQAPASETRLHALDFLRAAMMLLGLVLHSALAYSTFVRDGTWAVHDPATSPFFDALVAFIHAFRMPVFFLMAGFFAALLRRRRGSRGMLVNRLRRVALPFALALVLVPPLVSAGVVYAAGGGGAAALAEAARHVTSGAALRLSSLHHLWFLWYLLLFYAVALALLALLARLPGGPDRRLAEAASRAGSSAWSPALLAALVFPPLARMRSGTLETSSWFLPDAGVLAFYAVFFAGGWLLHDGAVLRPSRGGSHGTPGLRELARGAWMRLAAGVGLFALYYAVVVATWGPARGFTQLSRAGLLALAVAFLVHGLTGAVVRHLGRPAAPFRYLADASYWMYLVHLPVVVWLSGALAGWDAPAAVKFLAVLGGATLFTLSTYEVAVRRTAVGVLLNGRKAPRTAEVAARRP
jgi:peptidoglycan/LPS O-acetylase OafA/YrhL